MRLRPVNDKIVVKVKDDKRDEVTESGIILPDTAQQGKLKEAVVISVGEGLYTNTGAKIPVVVDEGDTILFSPHGGNMEHNVDGEEVLLMSVNEVLAVVEG